MPQFLVCFENRTHVVEISVPNRHSHDGASSTDSVVEFLLQDKLRQTIANRTGWPARRLTWESFDAVQQGGTLRTISCLRGGKGGFGSLLKGQSRQAGAKATTNFGACRDLQGRRLRHVNQAIEQRVWQEWKTRVEAGTATEGEMAKAMLNTDSGVAGWYLQLPAWAEVSFSQEQRKWKRQFHQWKKEQEGKDAAANERRRVQEAQVQSYLQAAQDASSQVQSNLKSALKEGLQAKRQKIEPDPPTALLTLAGEVTLAYNGEHNSWQVQSQSSNFCTVGIILRHDVEEAALYYEIMIETGGLVQVGWASTGFRPSSDAGDGVGDCSHSWAYDGSRQIKLHGESSEFSYGEAWKAGDIVGCLYNAKTREISYSLNGKDMGVAFKNVTHVTEGESDKAKSIFPAISCNPSEIVELRLVKDTLKYQPAGSMAVGDVLTEDVSLPGEDESDVESETEAKETTKNDAKERDTKSKYSSEQKIEKPALLVEPIDLNKYNSVEELESLGLDRLKGALMAIEVKCGGTLHERASRLFSLKGLKPEEYPRKLRAKRKA